MRRTTPLLLLALTAFFLVSCDSNEDDTTLSATLSGTVEVPPGDPDGSGTADITMDAGSGEVCYDITVSGVETIAAAHIHEGDPGVAGAIVIPFDADSGPLNGCVEDVDEDLIDRILDNPSDFYVNVHNASYPTGALRGQLTR